MVTVIARWKDARYGSFMLSSGASNHIIRRSSSYAKYTSSVWRAIQAIAECLITCKSRCFYYQGCIGPSSPARSFPRTITPEVPKRCSRIRLSRALHYSQCHPNRLARNCLGHRSSCDMVPSASGVNVQNFRHNLWFGVRTGE